MSFEVAQPGPITILCWMTSDFFLNNLRSEHSSNGNTYFRLNTYTDSFLHGI